MKIEIPEGFFPPHGVPFETEAQRDLAVAMHNTGVVNVQVGILHSQWITPLRLIGNERPELYRLEPPTPRTVGPFESVHEGSTHTTSTETAWARAMNEAFAAGIKRVRIKCTATAEEIL